MKSKSIFSEIWEAYRATILHSIITSFGLDFLVHDQNGGDVDTIHSVRETNTFKNAENEKAYTNRGEYNSNAYHHNEMYDSTIKNAKNSQKFIEDAYIPGNRIYYGKSSELRHNTEHKANLDHVISAKEIHDDPGRTLAGLDGVDLANQPENLRFTNEKLNKSMGKKNIEEYIKEREATENPLPEDVRLKMMAENNKARTIYNEKLEKAYYSSDRFLFDVGQAATSRGFEMGARQVLGFIFIEIWFSCEDEIKALSSGVSIKDCTNAIITGIKKGSENALKKYKVLISHFFQGFSAGTLASITTTLINIFITTDKNTVRYIRQIYTTVIQVSNILLINPDNLLLGDQLKTATVTLATGASVLAGTAAGNKIASLKLGLPPHLCYTIQNFCSALVSGLISCTLLIMIDRSDFIKKLIIQMNQFATVDYEIKEISDAFIQISTEIADLDINDFQENAKKLDGFSKKIINASDNELHDILVETYIAFDISLPWEGDFNSFMGNKNNCLVFE